MKRLVLFPLFFACFQPLFAQTTQLLKNEADSLFTAGKSLVENGDIKSSTPFFEKAFIRYKSIKDTLKYLESLDAFVNGLIASGKFNESKESSITGLSQAKALQNNFWISAYFSHLGFLANKNGFFKIGKNYYDSALTVALYENNFEQIATSYNNLGATYTHLGNYSSAIRFIKIAFDMRKKLGIEYQIAESLNNLAVNYYYQHDYLTAATLFEQSVELRRKQRNQQRLANGLINYATVLGISKEETRSAAILTETIQLCKKNDYKYLLGLASNKMGNLFYNRKNQDSAFYYFSISESIFTKLEAFDEVHEARMSIARILIDQNKYTDAKRLLLSSEAYISKFGASTSKLMFNQLLSKTYYSLNSDSCFYYFKLFSDETETINTNFFKYFQSPDQFTEFSNFFVEAAKWFLDRNQNQLAFELLEQSKSRQFLNDLSIAHQHNKGQIPDELRITLQNAADQVMRFKKEYYSENSDSIKILLSVAEVELDNITNTLRSDNPFFRNFHQDSIISLREAQQQCDNETAILEFAFSDSGLICFAITNTEVISWVIERTGNFQITASDLSNAIINYISAIESNDSLKLIQKQSEWLSSFLLSPAQKILGKKKHLSIVPDGALAYLPFETLLLNKNYLISTHSISYFPSLTALKLIKKPKLSYEKGAFIVTNPDFIPTIREGNPNFRNNEYYQKTAERNAKPINGLSLRSNNPTISSSFFFSPIPETEIEGNTISDIISNSMILTGGEATELNVKHSELSQFRFIHFATHGVINENHQELSGLVLAQNDTTLAGKEEDGYLRASEIYGLSLNAELVTLSACKTGLGKNIKGEGVLGLQRAFLYAGASAVVVSLWSVSDKSTSILMSDFYREVMKQDPKWYNKLIDFITFREQTYPPLSKKHALREAKLSMLNSKEYSHPFYWAPFILIGN